MAQGIDRYLMEKCPSVVADMEEAAIIGAGRVEMDRQSLPLASGDGLDLIELATSLEVANALIASQAEEIERMKWDLIEARLINNLLYEERDGLQ